MSVNRVHDWQTGEQLVSADLVQAFEACLDKAGAALSYALGIDSMQSAEDPLLYSVDGSSNVTIGGPNQRCILAGRQCDEINAQTFNYGTQIPVNITGSARVDTIYGAPAEPDTGAVLRNVEIAAGSFDTAMIGYKQQGASFTYVPAGGTPPAGSVAVLQVTVPASSGSIVSSDLVLLLKTPALALAQAVDLPFVNLDAYPGRDLTGATDQSAILIQAYADAASSGINQVRFSGNVGLSTLVNPVASVALVGAGVASSSIVQLSTSNDCFFASGVDNLEFRGFSVVAHASPVAGVPFYLISCDNLVMQDVLWTGWANPGLFETCQNLSWRNVNGTSNLLGGVAFNTAFHGNFVDCDFSSNGGHGVLCTGTNNSGAGWDMKFYGGRAVFNNQAASGDSGFYISANITGFQFFGFAFGFTTASPPANPQLYGLALAGGNDFLILVGCPMIGNATAPILGTLGANCWVTDCSGYNPVSDQGGFSQPAVPSTGAPYQNLYGADAMVLVTTGSVTFSTVTVGGLTFTSPTGQFLVPVRRGESITLNYTGGTPTWKWSIA